MVWKSNSRCSTKLSVALMLIPYLLTSFQALSDVLCFIVSRVRKRCSNVRVCSDAHLKGIFKEGEQRNVVLPAIVVPGISAECVRIMATLRAVDAKGRMDCDSGHVVSFSAADSRWVGMESAE